MIKTTKRKLQKENEVEARKEGHSEGLEQGSTARNIEIAKNLLSMDIDIEAISKATGLSMEELKEISSQ